MTAALENKLSSEITSVCLCVFPFAMCVRPQLNVHNTRKHNTQQLSHAAIGGNPFDLTQGVCTDLAAGSCAALFLPLLMRSKHYSRFGSQPHDKSYLTA